MTRFSLTFVQFASSVSHWTGRTFVLFQPVLVRPEPVGSAAEIKQTARPVDGIG